MLNGFLALLLCQFLGELFVLATKIPVPGPVIGMVIMLLVLITRGRTPVPIREVSEGLLRYLALLYVPAGVGLMVHLEMLSTFWLAILISLTLSTLLALLVTALIFKWLGASKSKGD